MSYFWTAVSFAVGGFICGTIWGRYLQSKAVDKIVAVLKPHPTIPQK